MVLVSAGASGFGPRIHCHSGRAGGASKPRPPPPPPRGHLIGLWGLAHQSDPTHTKHHSRRKALHPLVHTPYLRVGEGGLPLSGAPEGEMFSEASERLREAFGRLLLPGHEATDT